MTFFWTLTFLSQLIYCPLVWMLRDRTLNNKINRTREKALRIASQNKIADFNALLLEANSISIHKRNFQVLMIEVYKTVQNINPSFVKEIFVQKDVTHNLRNNMQCVSPKREPLVAALRACHFYDVSSGIAYPMNLKP